MAHVQMRLTKSGVERWIGYARQLEDKITTETVSLPDGSVEVVTVIKAVYNSAGTYDSHNKASRAAEAEEKRLREGSDISPAELMTVTALNFLPHFLRWHRKELNTLHGYQYLLQRFFFPVFGTRRMAEIQHSELQNFLIRLEEGRRDASGKIDSKTIVPPSTLKHLRAALAAYFTVARRHGVRDDLAAEGLTVPYVVRKEQECWDMRTYATVRKHLPNRPAQTFSDLQVRCGARIGEMIVLRPSDFDFVTGELRISRAAIDVPIGTNGSDNRIFEADRTKTKRIRRVSLGKKTIQMIETYIADYNIGPTELLFPARLVTPGAVYQRNPMTLEEKMADCAKQPIPTSKTGIVYEHGTVNAYITGKCGGAWCRSVGSEYSARRRAARRGIEYNADRGGYKRSTNAYLNGDAWGRMFNAAQEASSIEYRIPAKNLRHTHAVWCLEDLLMPGEKVAKRMGHTKAVLLENYLVRRAGSLSAEQDLFDSFDFDDDLDAAA